MSIELFDTVADAAQRRYSLFSAALAGAQAGMPVSTRLTEHATRRKVMDRVYQVGNTWINGENDHLSYLIYASNEAIAATFAALGSQAAADFRESVDEHLDGIRASLWDNLSAQMWRDVQGVEDGLRKAALRAHLSGVVFSTPDEDTRRTFRDRAGRTWSAEIYVRALWRHALVLAWNESALLVMASAGMTHAEVVHPDPDHPFAGLRVSLTEPALKSISWEKAREEIFHPNTRAYLRPVV